MKFCELKSVSTGFLDTPLHLLENLSKNVEKCNIYIKRDDLTGFASGGNKLRKLDYLVGDALDNGCTALLTYGGIQTNHGRLTAAAAARYGLKCGIIMDGPPPEKISGNLVLDKMMGADLFFMDDTDFKNSANYNEKYSRLKEKTTKEVIDYYEEIGDAVYTIPVGGSSIVGAVGYIDAAKEIGAQLDEMNIDIDYLVTGYGSVGTFAGLYLGSKMINAKYEVIGICVSEKSDDVINDNIKYMNSISEKLELNIDVERKDIWIEKDFVGKGYNIPDKETREYMYKMASEEAIILDPCYTGKVFKGMMELIKSGKIKKGSNVLFMHTGGFPGIYSEEHLKEINKDLWNEQKNVFKL
ncbi:MAG: D-cysteine desulfhydrase family protein [Clostridiales bacterium]|nr:D-cysteine desulfhydrase family protein [Clostridiales bacterium]